MEPRVDVAVIGGGLAGSMAALMLRRRGVSVAVLESRTENQPQKLVVGEALTEGSTLFFFHELGFDDWLKENAFRKFGFDFLVLPRHPSAPAEPGFDDCHELLMSLTPFERIPGAFRKLIPTWHVKRPVLNAELARRAEAAGADYRRGARVKEVTLGDLDHVVHYEDDAGAHVLRCTWVLDCSGWRSVLGRQLGVRGRQEELPTASVWTRFADVETSKDVWSTFGGIDRRRHTLHCSGPGFWIWWIHQDDGSTSVGVSYDTRQHAPDRSGPDHGFWEMIAKFPAVRHALAGARPLEPFQTYGHLPHGSDHWISERGYALIGDTAWFVDALYSTAIETAARQLVVVGGLVERSLKGERPCPKGTARLNEEFRYLQRAVLAHNRFKYEHAWHRPHVLFQVTLYELSEIAELYHMQDPVRWKEEVRDRHYRLQWGSAERLERLERFMQEALADADRDLHDPRPLRKALSPRWQVYWSTLPLWHVPHATPWFFKLTKTWGYLERLAQRRRIPDLLTLMTPPRPPRPPRPQPDASAAAK